VTFSMAEPLPFSSSIGSHVKGLGLLLTDEDQLERTSSRISKQWLTHRGMYLPKAVFSERTGL
jgi:hypothetical protein